MDIIHAQNSGNSSLNIPQPPRHEPVVIPVDDSDSEPESDTHDSRGGSIPLLSKLETSGRSTKDTAVSADHSSPNADYYQYNDGLALQDSAGGITQETSNVSECSAERITASNSTTKCAKDKRGQPHGVAFVGPFAHGKIPMTSCRMLPDLFDRLKDYAYRYRQWLRADRTGPYGKRLADAFCFVMNFTEDEPDIDFIHTAVYSVIADSPEILARFKRLFDDSTKDIQFGDSEWGPPTQDAGTVQWLNFANDLFSEYFQGRDRFPSSEFMLNLLATAFKAEFCVVHFSAKGLEVHFEIMRPFPIAQSSAQPKYSFPFVMNRQRKIVLQGNSVYTFYGDPHPHDPLLGEYELVTKTGSFDDDSLFPMTIMVKKSDAVRSWKQTGGSIPLLSKVESSGRSTKDTVVPADHSSANADYHKHNDGLVPNASADSLVQHNFCEDGCEDVYDDDPRNAECYLVEMFKDAPEDDGVGPRAFKSQQSRSLDKHRLRRTQCNAECVLNFTGVTVCWSHEKSHRLTVQMEDAAKGGYCTFPAVNTAVALTRRCEINCIDCARGCIAEIVSCSRSRLTPSQLTQLLAGCENPSSDQNIGTVCNAVFVGLRRAKLFDQFKNAVTRFTERNSSFFEWQLVPRVVCRFRVHRKTVTLTYKQAIRDGSPERKQRLRDLKPEGWIMQHCAYKFAHWLLTDNTRYFQFLDVNILADGSLACIYDAASGKLGYAAREWAEHFLPTCLNVNVDTFLNG